MAGRYPNPQRVKSYYPYTVEDVALLLRVHKNTVRRWIAEGLPVLDGQRPMLTHGAALKAFLQKRRQAAKKTCGPGQFFCFRCRAPRPPAGGIVDFVQTTDTTGMLKAMCLCGAPMNRQARTADIDVVMPGITVRWVPAHGLPTPPKGAIPTAPEQ